MDSVHHIWCPLFSQEFQDLPDGAETTLTIMEINGKDKRLNAVLRMADGRQTSVTTGSQLPGTSVTVKSISLSGVTLSDGTTLTF
ncbi:type IV pilus biogenesis protein PilP [Escherichia coli]|nr:type IV pilus biogenesis protein PilP [Escherichia coli]